MRRERKPELAMSMLICMTSLPEFDIPGDSTGILQSGLQFLTLHHYMTGSWVGAGDEIHGSTAHSPNPGRSTSLATVPHITRLSRFGSSRVLQHFWVATTCSSDTFSETVTG